MALTGIGVSGCYPHTWWQWALTALPLAVIGTAWVASKIRNG